MISPDPDASPSEEELRAAESLRASIEPGQARVGPNPDAELAEAIRAAVRPAPLSPDRHRRILAGSLANSSRGKVTYVVFGVASFAAMAASFALVMRPSAPSSSVALEAPAPMATSRSTLSLFPEGIPVTGGASDRIDRIAYARAQDLRENRFAKWGVR